MAYMNRRIPNTLVLNKKLLNGPYTGRAIPFQKGLKKDNPERLGPHPLTARERGYKREVRSLLNG